MIFANWTQQIVRYLIKMNGDSIEIINEKKILIKKRTYIYLKEQIKFLQKKNKEMDECVEIDEEREQQKRQRFVSFISPRRFILSKYEQNFDDKKPVNLIILKNFPIFFLRVLINSIIFKIL